MSAKISIVAVWLLLVVMGCGALPLCAQVSAEDETLLLHQPTVSTTDVVFVYGQDLWIVSRSGGVARRITGHQGNETAPRFSPDGKWIAFTADYEGNPDVYVMPAAGGAPTRLTWHPGADRVTGWHPDGKRVLFASNRAWGAEASRLYTVGIDGSPEVAQELPRAERATFNDDASKIIYTPIPDAFRTWKRYRGGRTTPIWIYNTTSREVEVIPHVNASDSFPAWLAGKAYFASDRDGVMNLYSFTPGDTEVTKLTNDREFDVRSVTAGGGVIAFEQGGAVHLYDPTSKSVTRLRIRCEHDGMGARPRWEDARGSIRSASIAPNGKRAAFEARGEIITVPKESGDARNLTQSPGSHDRSPSWSPDGAKIAWFSDASGEYRLMVGDAQGGGNPTAYDLGGGAFYFDPEWSPDGRHILFNDKANRLAFITLETSKVTVVSTTLGSLGNWRPSGAWSPDSKWIAFRDRNERTIYDRLALFNVETGAATRITDAFATADEPAFSRDGKHLFFRASIEGGPNRFGLDMSAAAARRGSNRLYVCVLAKASANPLMQDSDEGRDADPKADAKSGEKSGEKSDSKSESASKKTDEAPRPTVIDLDGLEQRIMAMPLGDGRFASLQCSKDKLYYLETPNMFVDDEDDAPTSGSVLKAFDFTTRKATTVTRGIDDFQISADGKSLLLRARDGWSISGLDAKEKKRLPIEGFRLRVDAPTEWAQTLREVWRIERDWFYDPNMHGVDWEKMWTRWSAFLPHIRSRVDLNFVIGEMIGELCCGHEYVGGGQLPEVPAENATGLIGADFTVENGRHRVARILRGQNWAPSLRSPLTGPGIDVREGDYLIEVNGKTLSSRDNLFAAFAGTANRRTNITVSSNADGSDPRKSTVVPVADDLELRKRSWIESNRRRVDELSKGQLAYVYMPDTGGGGLAAFDRDFYSQLDKRGLVLDERFNHGGMVADHVISVLGRTPQCYWMNREQWVGRTPWATLDGPKVMIINESAGSGGDAMPWLFRQEKLGTLVGTRTWGGLVGISGYPPLQDGGTVTAASFGIMDTNGNWVVENEGVAPDVEVIEWPKDMIEGRDPQLEKAVSLALEALSSYPSKPLPKYTPPSKR